MSMFHVSFLSRPVATVSAHTGLYLRWIAGGLALIVTVVASPLLTRSRQALVMAAIALGYPLLPDVSYPLIGAVAGVLAGLAIVFVFIPAHTRSVRGRRRSALARLSPPIAPLTTAAGTVVALSLIAPGWLGREARSKDANAAVLAFMLGQPGFVSDERPVALAPVVLATLAGPRLRHSLSLIPAGQPCPQLRSLLRRGWIVLRPAMAPGITTSFDAPYCLREVRPAYNDGVTVVYAPVSA